MLRKTVCLLAVTLAIAAPVQAKTKLRHQFKEGATDRDIFEQKMKITMNLNGRDVETKVDQLIEMRSTVKKIATDGTATVEVNFDRVKLSIDGVTGTAQADSKSDEEAQDPLGKVLGQNVKALASGQMTVVMEPTGDVKSVELSEATKKKLKAIPGASSGLSPILDEDALKAIAQGGLVFPKEPVKKGESWTHERDFDMPFGKIHSKTKYTYEDQQKKDGRDLAMIRYYVPEMKIEPNPDAPVKVEFKNVQAKGRALFDNQTGQTVEQVSEVTMQMNVEANGMTIMQNIVQETTIRPKQ